MQRLFLVAWMWALCVPGVLLAQGGEQARLEAERKAISDRIAATQSLLQSTRDDKARSTQEWAVLKEQLSLRQQLLSNLRAERRAAERRLSQRESGVHTADGQLADLKEEYARMIRLAARLGGRDQWWQVVLDAEGTTQAFRRLLLIEEYSASGAPKPSASRPPQNPFGRKWPPSSANATTSWRWKPTSAPNATPPKPQRVAWSPWWRTSSPGNRSSATNWRGQKPDAPNSARPSNAFWKPHAARPTTPPVLPQPLKDKSSLQNSPPTGVGFPGQSRRGSSWADSAPTPTEPARHPNRTAWHRHRHIRRKHRVGHLQRPCLQCDHHSRWRSRGHGRPRLPPVGLCQPRHGGRGSGDDLRTGQKVGTVIDLGDGPRAPRNLGCQGQCALDPAQWIAR